MTRFRINMWWGFEYRWRGSEYNIWRGIEYNMWVGFEYNMWWGFKNNMWWGFECYMWKRLIWCRGGRQWMWRRGRRGHNYLMTNDVCVLKEAKYRPEINSGGCSNDTMASDFTHLNSMQSMMEVVFSATQLLRVTIYNIVLCIRVCAFYK